MMKQAPIFKISMLLLMAFFGVIAFGQPPIGSSPQRVIAVNYSDVKGKHRTFFSEVVGAGRAAEGLRADWQRDLDFVHRECGFKYIRFHGLLQDEMGVYSEDKNGQSIYNFQYVDAVYDAILKIGMKPFVELSFMPRALASGGKTVFWWQGNITPPKDYDKWGRLIRALTQHWTDRYGAEEVRQWYFEVWNEPNLDVFWSGDQAEYFKLYKVTAGAIKSVSPNYRVGGPATAGNAWIPETINFAAKSNVALDFVTTHDYGVKGIGFDEAGQQLQLINDPDAIIGNVRRVQTQIASSARPKLPLHYTEWSTSYSPRDPVHDSYMSAPYILSKLKGTEGYADSMSYWTFTDIFEENGPVPSPFHGGFGLLNFQGLRKPAFYAYQFLNRLGNVELNSDDAEAWACRDSGGVQILFWKFAAPVTDESDQKFFKRDLPAKDWGKVRVSVAGLPPARYQMNVYRVGYQVNDVYADYLKIGSPPNLNRAQLRVLAEKNDGRAVAAEPIGIRADKPFIRDFMMRDNDVYLITVERSDTNALMPKKSKKRVKLF
jgi:xylan 1,4-beta-xylosidase